MEERRQDLENKRKKLKKKYHPGQEALEKEYVEWKASNDNSDEDDDELYFTEPKHLLDIFTALEEQNLFLIQNAQETEEAMEEVDAKFTEARRTMDAKTTALKENIAELEKAISEKRAMIKAFTSLGSKSTAESGGSADAAGEPGSPTAAAAGQLAIGKSFAQVETIHSMCGFDTEADSDPLSMLSGIEKKLEELFSVIDSCEKGSAEGKEFVSRLEKEKERDRRDRVRVEKKAALDKKNEERLAISLARSQAPVYKKVGKQIMFRSQPAQKKVKVVKVDEFFEQACLDFEKFGVWIDKEGIPQTTAPVATQ